MPGLDMVMFYTAKAAHQPRESDTLDVSHTEVLIYAGALFSG